MQALEVQNTIIPEEGEEEIISPQSVELSNEQQAQNTISALEAALENNNPEAIQIALEAVQKESEEAEIEAKTDGQMAVIQT